MTEIRTATTTDRVAIARLLRQLHPENDRSTLPTIRQDSRTFLATDGADPIGLAIVTFVDYGVEAYGTIEELVVDEAVRGRGVGRALLDRCRAWLAAEGAAVVFVSALDDAEPFYRRTGFRPCTGPWLYWVPEELDQSGQAITQ
ncbi:MAG TPA: GNAT family N-acetyltransferase [Mycobacteriales bacterium]|nr:GNAT family N-acetyltransferase [Mycobacteriales bacterium]